MHWILLFVEHMAVYAIFLIGTLLLGIWAFSSDDSKTNRLDDSWFWVMCWPLLFFFSRFSNRAKSRRVLLAGNITGAAESVNENRHAKRCLTLREAKDYLAERIATEAEREGIPLSNVEQKMLYFAENESTLPDMMEVSAEFDRGYDQNEYERKIAGLAEKIQLHDEAQSKQEQENWDLAVEKLSEGDNYLSVMIDAARPRGNPARRKLRVLAAILGFLALAAFGHWLEVWMDN